MIANHPPRRAMEFPAVTWANRPSAATSGQIIRVTDLNNALFIANGTDWVPVGGECVFWKYNGAPIVHTGTVAETVLVSKVIPAGLLGTNGSLFGSWQFGYTNSGGTKDLRLKLGAIGNVALARLTGGAQLMARGYWEFSNVDSQSSQRGGWGASFTGAGSLASSSTTNAVDTSVDQTLYVTGGLSSAGDTLQIESLCVILYKV